MESGAFNQCFKLSLVIYLGVTTLSSSIFHYFLTVHALPTYGSDSFCGTQIIRRCIKTDSCGASTNYIFDECTGTLIISGQGAMHDYKNDLAPWSLYKDNIKSVIIEGDVTSIGNNGFSECTELTSVTILSFVKSIGSSAFSGCSNLETITFDESKLTIIGKSSFY